MSDQYPDQAAPAAPIVARPAFHWGTINGDRAKFMPLTFDVFAALFHLDANASERKLIHYILHWSWGDVARRGRTAGKFGDAQACVLNVSALARLWKVSRAHLNDARAALLRDRVIVPLGPGFTLNKNVDDWSETRIARGSVDFARTCGEFPATQHVPDRVHVPKRRHVPDTVQNTSPESTEVGTSSVPGRVHQEAAAYRNAGASEDFKKTSEEQTTNSRGGAPLNLQGQETPSRPVERCDAVLVADELPPAPGRAAPLPPAAKTAEELEDERLADWCRAEVDRVYPDNEMHGEAIWRGVRQWRRSGHERGVIAAFVLDACGVSFPEIRTNVPKYVASKLGHYKPGDACPPIPDEWKPEVRGPELYVPDDAAKARIAERKAREARGETARRTKTPKELADERRRARVAELLEVAS